MPNVQANEIALEYRTHGNPADTPLLLVHGLGVQLTAWPDDFLAALVDSGFYVITYDNRDVGLSTKFDSWGTADITAAFRQARAKEPVNAPYTLADMADDGISLLAALGLNGGHVLGLSNGGAIAQIMAIRHPDRVKSLVSMMATSGRRRLPRPSETAQAWLNRQRDPNESKAEYVQDALASARLLGSPGFPADEAAIEARAVRDYERCYYPAGSGRHFLASIASGDSRAALLPTIRCPTLVVHGAEDPLVPLAQGEDVYRSIPGAELLVIEGMAHDVPNGAVPEIVAAIAANARRAEGEHR